MIFIFIMLKSNKVEELLGFLGLNFNGLGGGIFGPLVNVEKPINNGHYLPNFQVVKAS